MNEWKTVFLDVLISAIRAGALCDGEMISSVDINIIDDAGIPDIGETKAWETVCGAMRGSVDAALALKDAVLPDGSGNEGSGWTLDIHIGGVTAHGGPIGTMVEISDGSSTTANSVSRFASDQITARAVLLATLLAYRAKLEPLAQHLNKRTA